MYSDDLEQLAASMTLYDAFYRWARDASDETHDWPTNPPKKVGGALGSPANRSSTAGFNEGEAMSRTAVIAILVPLVWPPGALLSIISFSPDRPVPVRRRLYIETEVATWLLLQSVPPEAAARANP